MPKRVAELAQFLLVQFFLLVRDVAAFAGFAQSVTFDGLGQDHRRLALVFDRRFVGGINLCACRGRRAAACGSARRVR